MDDIKGEFGLSKKTVGDKGLKYDREDIKVTSMLLMCILTVMVCAVSIISIYEEKSLLDLIHDVASEAEAIMTDGKSEMVKIEDETVPLADGKDTQPNLKAKRNSYDLSNLYEDEYYRYYFEGDERASKVGIDVSYYQGKIDWKKVKKSGVDFAIIRLGYRGYLEGELALDKKYKYNIKHAKKNGIDVGVYFFTQAITEKEAIEEAKYCLKYVKGHDLEYPIVIDTEAINADNVRSQKTKLNKDELTKVCKAFCDTINDAGYESAIYASKSWFFNRLNLEKLDGYNKWLAHYTKITDYKYDFDIWQYSSDGKVPGIKGRVDVNIGFDK